MRLKIFRAVSPALLLIGMAVISATAATAQPGTGPRERIDQRFTTARPDTPTGIRFTAAYHAPGDAKAPPPYLRRMVFYPPRGMRYDTRVPDRCPASDAVLQTMGPSACPAGSLLGTGTTEGVFQYPFAHDFVFDHFRHHVDVLNNTSEQIVLIQSEGWTVVRGRIRPDGAIDWRLPTCFPANPAGDCADEYIIQLKNATRLAPLTKRVRGEVRSYATTPPRCPARGYWQTTVRYWWADGAVDSVPTKQPCVAAASGPGRERAG